MKQIDAVVVETGTMISKSETKQLTPNVVISELETMEVKPGRLDFSKIKSKQIEKNSTGWAISFHTAKSTLLE